MLAVDEGLKELDNIQMQIKEQIGAKLRVLVCDDNAIEMEEWNLQPDITRQGVSCGVNPVE